MVWQLAQTWPSITITLLVIYWIAIAIVIISDEREPTETLAWMLVAFAFPLLGLIFYFLFGRNWKKIAARSAWAKEIFALALPTMNRVWGKYADTEKDLLEWAEPKGYAPIIKTALAADTTHVLPAYDVKILRNGDALFPRAQGGPAQRQGHHQLPGLHLGARPAHRRAHSNPDRARSGRRRGPPAHRLRRLYGVQEGRDQGDAGRGREVP